MTEPLRILSLGWGVQSWTIAAMIALGELPPIDFAVHADTTWEKADTYALAAQQTPWLEEHGVKVVTVRSRFTKVIERWESKTEGVMIPAFTKRHADAKRGQLARQCTRTWKIDPIRRFASAELRYREQRKVPGAVVAIMGISWDEAALRVRNSDVAYVVNEYPLVDRRITRQDCVGWLEAHGLPVPTKSSCTFCPYHTLDEWRDLARRGGEDWATSVRVDEAIRNKRQILSLFVHPSRVPLEEALHREHEADESDGQATCDSGYCFT